MALKFAVFLILISLGRINTFAQKIDTLLHVNGNILTGDFKKLEYGIVSWKMDGMETMSIETPKVRTFRSKKRYDVRMYNGVRYFCSFDTSSIFRKVKIITLTGSKLVNIDDIVRIFPIKKNFWLRTSGRFGIGANYTKGSDLGTLNFSSSLEHRQENSNYSFSWDNYYTFNADTLSSTKANMRLGWERLRRKKLSFGTSIGMSQNSELGTKLRLDVSVVGIYDFIFNDWMRLYSATGVSLQRENPYDDSQAVEDVVGSVSLGLKVYKLTKPKIWIDSDVNFIPYLTSDERYRMDVNVNPEISLIGNDLKLGLRVYYSLDTKPATENASKEDWGTNLEISYTFH